MAESRADFTVSSDPRLEDVNAGEEAAGFPLGDFFPLDAVPDMPPAFEEKSLPALADQIKNAPGAGEKGCREVDPRLRAVIFEHFQTLQAIENQQGRYFKAENAEKWAHMLGMVIKESSGDSVNVTDMNGKESSTYRALTSVPRWKALFSHPIVYNSQTNFGLAQQSTDRLMVSFPVKTDLADILPEGKERKSGKLSRGILRFYQEMARGHISSNEPALSLKESEDPANKEKASRGRKAALWHCGTRFLFQEGGVPEGEKALEEAMASIAYCEFGKGDSAPTKDNMRCFGRWVTLCPALNLDIALLNPNSYFATRKTAPLCLATFQKLIKPKP